MASKQRAVRERGMRQWLNQEQVAGVVCTLPFTIGLLMFIIVPMLLSLYYSLCDYNILSAPQFIGVDNYIRAFVGDQRFWTALGVTFFFALVSVPLRLVFALAVAVLLVRPSRMSAFYRAVYYLPSIIGGSVAVSILWKRMFALDGVVNGILQTFGIEPVAGWAIPRPPFGR